MPEEISDDVRAAFAAGQVQMVFSPGEKCKNFSNFPKKQNLSQLVSQEVWKNKNAPINISKMFSDYSVLKILKDLHLPPASLEVARISILI